MGRRQKQQLVSEPPVEGNSFDPWEKGLKPDDAKSTSNHLESSRIPDAPRIDSKGNARRYPRAGQNGIREFVDPGIPGEVFPRKHIGGGGEPLFDDNGDVVTKRMGNLTTIHGARRTGS